MAVLIVPSRNLWLPAKPPVGSQIDWGHPLADKMFFCLLFNDAGHTLHDVTGRTPDGVAVYGTPVMALKGLTRDYPGGIGQNGDYFNHHENFNVTGDISVVHSFIYNTLDDYRFLFAKEEAVIGYNSCIPSAYYHATGKLSQARGNGSSAHDAILTTTSISAGNWYVAAFTHLGTAMKAYLNGHLDNTGVSSATPTSISEEFRIATRNYTGGVNDWSADCSILYIYMWARALTKDEILWLYTEPYAFIKPITRRFYSVAAAAPTELELRSSTDTDARISLDTEVSLSLRSSTDTDARIALETGITLALRSSTDTDTRAALDTQIGLGLRSSTGTDARVSLTIGAVEITLRTLTGTAARISLDTQITIILRSSTDTDARIALGTEVSLALRSSTDTDARITLAVSPLLELRSSTDTDARLALDTGVALSLRSSTDTDARITLTIAPLLELRSSTDTDARIALGVSIALALRSSTDTDARLALSFATQLALRSSTGTSATILLSTVVTLALLSQTNTRAAIALTVMLRHQAITMAMQDRSLSMKIPARTFGQEVRQDG